jgi:hypothetical protein
MSKLVQIPEAALAALLREAGHTESVEAYLASADVQAAVVLGEKLVRRANAAYWSRFWLLFSAVVSWLGFFGAWDAEDLIAAILLTGMTVVEFKVYDFFRAADVRGAVYGWWNQCLFSALFLVYGAYHGRVAAVPPGLSEWIDASMVPAMLEIERGVYWVIGVVGAIGQFWLASYYRQARA